MSFELFICIRKYSNVNKQTILITGTWTKLRIVSFLDDYLLVNILNFKYVYFGANRYLFD